MCKVCGGGGICEHGRRRTYCKECGGSQICEHGRRRRRCKECLGDTVCKHDRRKYDCIVCMGKSLCEHGKRRPFCKECGGSQVCAHGRRRNTCKQCGGQQICEHGQRRGRCTVCGGSELCEHGHQRHRCTKCRSPRTVGAKRPLARSLARTLAPEAIDWQCGAPPGAMVADASPVPAAAAETAGSSTADAAPRAGDRVYVFWEEEQKNFYGKVLWCRGGQCRVLYDDGDELDEDIECIEIGRRAVPKLSRYEAMWTDCDPSLWEYVVV